MVGQLCITVIERPCHEPAGKALQSVVVRGTRVTVQTIWDRSRTGRRMRGLSRKCTSRFSSLNRVQLTGFCTLIFVHCPKVVVVVSPLTVDVLPVDKPTNDNLLSKRG